MPIHWDGTAIEVRNPPTGAVALTKLADRRADRMKLARKSRGLSLTQFSRLLESLGEGLGVSKSTLTNYETQTSRRTAATAANLDLISLALQYDPRYLLAISPYDHADDEGDLHEASLSPALAGYYWPRDADMPYGCMRYEVYEHSSSLSLVVLKDPVLRRYGAELSSYDADDKRVLVGGDRVLAYAYVLHELRHDDGYLRRFAPGLSEEELRRAIPALDEAFEGQYGRLLLLDGRYGLDWPTR